MPPREVGPPAGRRRARHSKPGRPRVASVPAVIGAAALVLAGAGAVVAGTTGVSGPSDDAGPLEALSITLATGKGDDMALTNRTHLVQGQGGELVRVSRSVGRDDLQQQAELQARQRMAALQELAQAAQDQANELRSNQWVLPLAGYTLSASFGDSSSLWATTHTGQDFAAAEGTPIVAVASGVVTQAGYDPAADWAGNLTVVKLDDGTEIWYAHQSSIRVRTGDVVAPGAVIGYVGSTGNSTGPHLHLEVRPGGGDPVDPVPMLVEHGVQP